MDTSNSAASTRNSAASTRITDQIPPTMLNAPVPEVRGLGPSISPNRKARRAAAARARRSR